MIKYYEYNLLHFSNLKPTKCHLFLDDMKIMNLQVNDRWFFGGKTIFADVKQNK